MYLWIEAFIIINSNLKHLLKHYYLVKILYKANDPVLHDGDSHRYLLEVHLLRERTKGD